MLIVLSVFLFLIAVLGFLRYRFVLNPVSMMCLLWAILLPLSAYGFYGTRIPQTRTYVIIAVGVGAYLLGIFLGSKRVKYVIRSQQKGSVLRGYSINYTFLYVIMSISLIYYLIQSIEVFRILRAGNSYAYVRILVASNEKNALQSSRLLLALRAFIAVPTTYLAIAILPIELFYGKRKKTIIFGSVALMLLFIFTNGARSVIMWIAIYFLLVYLVYRRNHEIRIKLSRKYRRWLMVGGTVLLLLMFYMTIFRKGEDVDLGRQMYIYFIAPIPHFDHYIDVVDMSGEYGYGFSSFYGVVYPFLYILRIIIGSYSDFISNIYYMSFEMMESGYNLGNSVYMNAFVTTFYQPYLDGRYVGVIVILMIFGYMCSRTFKRTLYNEDLKSMLLYSLLLQKIIFSFVRFYFTQQAQAMCFLFAMFAIKRIYSTSEMEGDINGFRYHSNIQ